MSNPPEQFVPLSQLTIHLVHACSLTCRPCHQQIRGSANGRGNKFLPSILALQAMQEALSLGLRMVRLVGDTSLCYPDLDPLLDRVESLGLSLIVETNGTGLTTKRVQRLARLPNASVWVGLDGTDTAAHDASRQQAGAFTTAIQGIRTLAEAGLSVQVVFTVHRSNAGKIPEVIRLVEELGGEAILFTILEPGQPARPNLELQVEEMIALGWRVERELANITRLRLLFGMPPVFRGLHPRSVTGSTGQLLNAWDGRCSILSGLSLLTGGEYALCDLALVLPNFILGRAGADPLRLIWNSHPLLQILRQGMPERLEGVCSRCTVNHICMGFCAGENYQRSGTFWAANWFCETAERVGLFPSGRLIEN